MKQGKTDIRQLIQFGQDENKKRAFEQCLSRGFHKPYPNGYFERCFDCGSPLTLTILEEDILTELKYEFLDLMSSFSKNETVDMFRLHFVAQKLGISI